MRFGAEVIRCPLNDHLEPGTRYVEIFPTLEESFTLRKLPAMSVRSSQRTPKGQSQSPLLLKVQYVERFDHAVNTVSDR